MGGRYIPTGFVAAQLYVNQVLIFGFLFLSLMTCWLKISHPIMPLPPPKIFKLLEFWRPPEGCLFGVFMFKLIWSHYEPVTKVSVVLICLATLILAFYQVFGRPPDKSLSLMKHGSNMWSKVYHSAHEHIFCWYFPREMSHFCSNSYGGVQVKYASRVYRWVHEHVFRWYIPRKMSHFCSNSYRGVQVKYASRAQFRVQICRVFDWLILWGSHAYYAICHYWSFERIYHRKRSKGRRKSKFRRRRLPYHCVMRCYSRTGNRPHRIGISRFESRRARRLKRHSRKIKYRRKLKKLRRGVKLSEDRALYEA